MCLFPRPLDDHFFTTALRAILAMRLSVCRMVLEVPMFRRTLAVVTGLTMVSVDVDAPAGHRLARSLVGANGGPDRASQRSGLCKRPHGHGASARSPDSIRRSRPRSRGKRGPSRGPNVCSCLGASGATRRVAPGAPRQVQLSGWVIWACHTQTAQLYGYKRRLCRTGEGGSYFPNAVDRSGS